MLALFRSTHVVRHGSLDVPSFAERDFELAVNYLSRDAVMRRIIDRAEHERARLHLHVNHRNDDSFDPDNGIVNWDPHSALSTTGGGRQSPALGLGHELDHATARAAIRDRGAEVGVPRYDNAEERRVILGAERHAAFTLGESVRHDHGGECYRVDSPIAR